MREAISPKQKLFATQLYLISELTFEGLKFETVIAAQTLGKVVINNCKAIIKVLKKFIEVNNKLCIVLVVTKYTYI